jgi:hypothetical protein
MREKPCVLLSLQPSALQFVAGDVNEHKTNLFFWSNFHFISLSKRNKTFYA